MELGESCVGEHRQHALLYSLDSFVQAAEHTGAEFVTESAYCRFVSSRTEAGQLAAGSPTPNPA